MPVRDPLDWSLPLVWHLNASRGNTPMIARRTVDFGEHAHGNIRFDLEGDSHIVTGRTQHKKFASLRTARVGAAFIHRNSTALPRARLIGKPIYAADRLEAIAAIERAGASLRDQLVVEDPDRPLAVGAAVSGDARIVEDLPERVVVETDAAAPAYLILADTFDPGWSATVDRAAGSDPARLCRVPGRLPTAGAHTIIFTYRPAGFERGLILSGCGIVLALVFWFFPGSSSPLGAEHAELSWPSRWRTCWFFTLGAIVLVSAVTISPSGIPRIHPRWKNSVHTHTWGAGVLAMKANRM